MICISRTKVFRHCHTRATGTFSLVRLRVYIYIFNVYECVWRLLLVPEKKNIIIYVNTIYIFPNVYIVHGVHSQQYFEYSRNTLRFYSQVSSTSWRIMKCISFYGFSFWHYFAIDIQSFLRRLISVWLRRNYRRYAMCLRWH